MASEAGANYIKDCPASTLHGNIARVGFELMGPIRAASPIPRHRPDQKSLQAEATTCSNPESVDFSGFFFMAVDGLPTTFGYY